LLTNLHYSKHKATATQTQEREASAAQPLFELGQGAASQADTPHKGAPLCPHCLAVLVRCHSLAAQHEQLQITVLCCVCCTLFLAHTAVV
jgi:hypothetical protein